MAVNAYAITNLFFLILLMIFLILLVIFLDRVKSFASVENTYVVFFFWMTIVMIVIGFFLFIYTIYNLMTNKEKGGKKDSLNMMDVEMMDNDMSEDVDFDDFNSSTKKRYKKWSKSQY